MGGRTSLENWERRASEDNLKKKGGKENLKISKSICTLIVFLVDKEVVKRLVDSLVVVILNGTQVGFD